VKEIEKTIEDMKLRNAKGLIVCSEKTKLSSTIEMNFQKEVGNLQIIKIKPLEKN
jgi:hypothetical protein